MELRTTDREETLERWQDALKRAHDEGVQVRQLAGCGMWIATSGSDVHTAYEVTPWACECHAAQFGDPICKHRAALLERLGRLEARHHRIAAPDGMLPCGNCNGMGSYPGTESIGTTWRYANITCEDCHGTGVVEERRAA